MRRRSHIVHAATPKTKWALRIEVRRYYKQKARQAAKAQRAEVTLLVNLRLAELERLLVLRYGGELPDDDAGREDFMIIAHHLANRRSGQCDSIVRYALRWCPWMPHREATLIAAETVTKPLKWTADELGTLLRLTDAERTALSIRTIGAFEVNKGERIKRRMQKRRDYNRAYRAKKSSGRPRGRPRKLPKLNARPIKLTYPSAGLAINSALDHDAKAKAGGASRPGRADMYLHRSWPLLMLKGRVTRKADADRGIANIEAMG